MMTEQKHLIKRQLIELQVPSRADAHAVQAEVSRIYRQRLVPLIDQLCSEMSGPEVRHRIDRLEVDLGVIPVDGLETALVTQTRLALRQALAAQISNQPTADNQPGKPATAHAQLELFAHFARTGNLLWWADAGQPRLLADCLTALLQQPPAALHALVQTLVRAAGPRRRLILHFADEQLAGLAGLLVPAYAAALNAAAPGWLALLAATPAAERQGVTAPRQRFWDNLLLVAALGGPAYTTLAAFYQAVLNRVAAASGVAYRILLNALQQRATANPALIGDTFPRTLESLASAAPSATPSPAATATVNAALAQQVRQLAALGGALADLWCALQALLPYLTPSVQRALLASLPAPVADEGDDALVTRLRIRQQLQPVLTDPSLPAALRDDLTQFLWAHLPGETIVPAAATASADLGHHSEISSALTSGESVTRSSRRVTDSPGAEVIFRRSLPLRTDDELYIANAGLVILWPFLSHFFAHRDLLAGKAFKDDVAQQRGVGLLQALVNGDDAWPEYHLPLNKLLCGLELDAVFDFGPPLGEDEAEECLDLLNAVIAQAPILNAMTADGFRATFLQRAGVLRAQDGTWLLQVERATYDIVLDRFPWSWQWVKLPWMDAPQRVAW